MTIRSFVTHRSLAAVTLVVMASLARPAEAQTKADQAMAEGLFQAGRALVAEEKYPEACPKFAESQRLDPRLGTLMNLALCHEKEGKTASAWAEYTQASQQATLAAQGERADIARVSAARLAPTVPHVLLRVQSSVELSVTLDGEPIRPAVLGTPIPLDPGPHQVGASLPGHKAFGSSLVLTPASGTVTVTIPELEPDAPVQGPTVAAPVRAADHRMLGYVLVGSGGVAIVTGAVFGILAFAEKSAAEGQCSAAGPCTSQGQSDISLKKASEVVSTVGIGAGLVAAGAGVYFVLRSRHHDGAAAPPVSLSVCPSVGAGGGASSLMLSGKF